MQPGSEMKLHQFNLKAFVELVENKGTFNKKQRPFGKLVHLLIQFPVHMLERSPDESLKRVF